MALRYEQSLALYNKIPSAPIAYWLSTNAINSFDNKKVKDVSYVKAGVVSGNDKQFVRLWFEVSVNNISFRARPFGEYGKYHIFAKGGEFRRYYGNYEHIIALADLYDDTLVNESVRRGDRDSYFKRCISWSIIGSSSLKSFRAVENSVCGTASPSVYVNNSDEYYYMLGLLNSKFSELIINCLNPTLNLQSSDVGAVPFKSQKNIRIDELVQRNIQESKTDWDSFETSWDFKKHPLI